MRYTRFDPIAVHLHNAERRSAYVGYLFELLGCEANCEDHNKKVSIKIKHFYLDKGPPPQLDIMRFASLLNWPVRVSFERGKCRPLVAAAKWGHELHFAHLTQVEGAA